MSIIRINILPAWEQWIYLAIGVSSLAFSWWRLYIEGNALQNQYLHYGLERKWPFSGRYYDTTDSEWSLWREKLSQHLSFCFTHVLLSQACWLLKCSVKARMCVLILYDAACLCAILGPKVIVYMLFKTGLVWVASYVGHAPGVWGLLGFGMLANNVRAFKTAQDSFLGLSDSTTSFIFLVANGFLDIRLFSFGIDNAKMTKFQNTKRSVVSSVNFHDAKMKLSTDKRNEEKENIEAGVTNISYILEVLIYLFYFPSFIHGPIYLFHEFRQQMKSNFGLPQTSNLLPSEFKNILVNILRIFFWMFFMEVSLHFLYFGALAYNSALRHLSVWALVAVGHSTGQFFMVKYLVFYGLAGQLGRFDGIVAPLEPRCISWVYSYTDMWKHFDTGLYNFIKVYVYIPLGGSRHGLVRQLAASGLVFLFIYIWHGGTYFLFIWCCGNYLVGSLEGIACVMERSSLGDRLISLIGPKMLLRMKCLLFAPAYLASCLQTFYFLFHVQDAWEITERILLTTSWTQFGILMGVFYACIHNAMFIRNRVCKAKKDTP